MAKPAAHVADDTSDENVQQASTEFERYVDLYLGLRAQKQELDAEYKAALEPIESAMDDLEALLNVQMGELGVDSLRTKFGTAICVKAKQAVVQDWAIFADWIIANGRVDALQKRVVTSTIEDVLTETGDLPPGVVLNTKRTVQVRVPTKPKKNRKD